MKISAIRRTTIIGLIINMCNETESVSLRRFETLFSRKVKEENVYFKGRSRTLLHCTTKCATDARCMSTSFNGNDGSCHLTSLKVNRTNDQQGLDEEPSWRTTYSECSTDVGWAKIGDRFYHFNRYQTKNFTDSETYCKEIKGKLAEPQTITAFELLRAYIIDYMPVRYYYIGLKDVAGDNKFVWLSTGAAPVYSVWVGREPTNRYGEDCACLYNILQYKWGDCFCNVPLGMICEC